MIELETIPVDTSLGGWKKVQRKNVKKKLSDFYNT